MPKPIEYGVRSPKAPAAEEKQEKSVEYGVRTIGDNFEKRANEVNTPPMPKNHYASGAKFDSKEPNFKKFK